MSARRWLRAWSVCGVGLACLCRVFCPRPGPGRGAALGGCPLGCLGVVLRGECATTRLFVVAQRAAGFCARVIWGWPFGGGGRGGLAWVGVVSAAHELGLGLLVGGPYVSLCV